jgi:hypothetical protein
MTNMIVCSGVCAKHTDIQLCKMTFWGEWRDSCPRCDANEPPSEAAEPPFCPPIFFRVPASAIMNLQTGACAHHPDMAWCEKNGNEILWVWKVCNNECPHCEAGQGANDTSGYNERKNNVVNRLAEEFNAQVKQSAARKGHSRDGDDPKWFRAHNSLLRKQDSTAHAIAEVEERARWLEVRRLAGGSGFVNHPTAQLQLGKCAWCHETIPDPTTPDDFCPSRRYTCCN